jgi:ATP-dependent helicase HrpB
MLPEQSKWIVAPEVDAGERMGRIRLAVPVSEERAQELLAPYIIEENVIEWNGLVPRKRTQRSAGKILLQEITGKPTREETAEALQERLVKEGLGCLPWDENKGEAARLLSRIRFFEGLYEHHGVEAGGEAPARSWSDEALAESAGEWLGGSVWSGEAGTRGPCIDASSLMTALKSRFGWGRLRELDEKAPGYVTTSERNGKPGRKRPVDYSTGEPHVSIRLLDAYHSNCPALILGTPVTYELLSPADRPVQITRDLDGFWEGSYKEVRKDMKARYPKHPWP